MASLNKVMLIGNLTRDPQLSYLPSQTAVVEFGIAINRKFKKQDGTDGEEVCFVDCQMFGKRAEVINQYFTKGNPIFVEGRLKFEQWQDKQTGQGRTRLRVFVENFEFIGAPNNHGGQQNQPQGYQNNNQPGYQQQQPPQGCPPHQGQQNYQQPSQQPQYQGPSMDDDIPF